MTKVDELLQEFAQEARVTRVVLERVPEGRLGWKPHEKSMTLGQLAFHIATVPGAIAGLSTRPEFDVNTRIPRPDPARVEEILAAHDESVATVGSVLGGMDDGALAAPWRMVDGEREVMAITRGDLLRSVMLNHWYHHRGQMTVYLRQVGVPVPAVYGPSADESPFEVTAR